MKEAFSSLFGNESAKSFLYNAIASNNLPHALIVSGPYGSGKHTLARNFAAAALCEGCGREKSAIPCGFCNSCRKVFSKNHPDVKTLARASSKATIGVEEVRIFREDMFLSPTEAERKFYIIEDADRMTPASQNALLKVLEEPPSTVHILLLTEDSDKLLTTIKSRAQLIRMQLFEKNMISKYLLENVPTARSFKNLSAEKFDFALICAGGVIGKAISMLDKENIENYEKERASVLDFISCSAKRIPFSKLYISLSQCSEKRDSLKAYFEKICMALSDMIAAKKCGEHQPIFFKDSAEAEKFGENFLINRLVFIYDVIRNASEDLEKNASVSTILTDIAVKIKTE